MKLYIKIEAQYLSVGLASPSLKGFMQDAKGNIAEVT